jgi:hypothetical protein
MKKIAALVSTGLILAVMAISAGPASAVSPSEQSCTESGGTFDRNQGQVSCTQTDTGKNPKFTDVSTTTGQGNTDNKQVTENTCSGAGGSGKCPPGQFN